MCTIYQFSMYLWRHLYPKMEFHVSIYFISKKLPSERRELLDGLPSSCLWTSGYLSRLWYTPSCTENCAHHWPPSTIHELRPHTRGKHIRVRRPQSTRGKKTWMKTQRTSPLVVRVCFGCSISLTRHYTVRQACLNVKVLFAISTWLTYTLVVTLRTTGTHDFTPRTPKVWGSERRVEKSNGPPGSRHFGLVVRVGTLEENTLTTHRVTNPTNPLSHTGSQKDSYH